MLITKPWVEIVNRKPSTRRRHWNASLQMKWKEVRRARAKARKSGLDIDRAQLKEKRRAF